MDLAMLFGRIAIVVLFVFSGVMKFVDASGTAGHIAEQGLPAPMLFAYAAGALEIVGGLAIAVGLQTRYAAISLAIFTGVAALIFHDFWAFPAGEPQVQQMLHFLKNVSMIGGLMVLAAAGPGRFGLDHRLGRFSLSLHGRPHHA